MPNSPSVDFTNENCYNDNSHGTVTKQKENAMETAEKDFFVNEETCPECDETFVVRFKTEDFDNHETGRIVCPKCGRFVMPCNACNIHSDCANCPWKNANAVSPMTDRGYVLWCLRHSPQSFEMMLEGKLGSVYEKIAKSFDGGTRIVCGKCGHEVEDERVLTDYGYFCKCCDENLYSFEVDVVK